MANVLNYKYEIFPTRPQKRQLGKVLRESRFQWNKAVTIRRKLKRALVSGQLDHVLKTTLSSEKDNQQAQRKSAILKFKQKNPNLENLDFNSTAKLYDMNYLFGKILPVTENHLEISNLAKELKNKFNEDLNEYIKAKKNGIKGKNIPKRPIYWKLMGAINNYAGFAAKKFMDESFKSPRGMSLASVRANISGYQTSIRWNQSVNPKKGQRDYGATGEPNYKRRADGFTCQIPQKSDLPQFIRRTRKGNWQICLNMLHEKNRWVNVAYHRPIPIDGKMKQLTINQRAGKYFAVFSVDTPDSAWRIEQQDTLWNAGIDPGQLTALTMGLEKPASNNLSYIAIHYEFLEKSLDKLEKMQQSLALKTGPRRKRTEQEINTALSLFADKNKVRKLTKDEKEKAIAKEKARLERTMTKQDKSKRWDRWRNRVSAFQYKIACQRADVLHKISRALAESCSLIGFGHWEPEREISYRKKIRAAKKKVKKGVEGAQKELDALLAEKSKQGPKGSVKKRRSGRDRSIATLKRLIEEKAQRSGASATKVNEAGSTYTCCVCGAESGPRGKENLSVREWRCKECNTDHNRDLNSAFNIVKKAAAQAAIPATESTVAKAVTQGAELRHVGDNWPTATGSWNRGDLSFKNQYQKIRLWENGVPKSLKSLMAMGIARSFSSPSSEKTEIFLDST